MWAALRGPGRGVRGRLCSPASPHTRCRRLRCAGLEPGPPPSRRCWSCGRAVPEAGSVPGFCPTCRALQPPGPRPPDFYRLLGCERSFHVDISQLQQRFRNLQRSLHPDYFSQRPQAERAFSEQHSSLVNKAYQTLLNPLSRGLYLLELNGMELAERTDIDIDVDFLADVMEINENLAEAKNDSKIEEIGHFVEAKKEELTKDISKAFERDDLQEAKKLLAKMKYFANLMEKVKSKKTPSLADIKSSRHF
uniref:Iron-sulfur cluster co-chaperone protein HscB n=1 Tax=Sphenodon punctatus TaxID=8508 RepID=A0A8D0GR59_SPHPU